MSKKLSWSEIKNRYEGQWVSLTDVEWEWHKPHPASARVSHNASRRHEVLNDSAVSDDGIVLFVGHGISFSALSPTHREISI